MEFCTNPLALWPASKVKKSIFSKCAKNDGDDLLSSFKAFSMKKKFFRLGQDILGHECRMEKLNNRFINFLEIQIALSVPRLMVKYWTLK